MADAVPSRVEDLLRELAPQVLGALIHRYGRFDTCEDATQEALLRAARHWPVDGVPDNPRGWLVTAASRVLIDAFRSDSARRRREDAHFAATPQSDLLGRPADEDRAGERDDSLDLLFLCCHPSLPVPSRIALTLRAVGGLTTAQIAAGFLVPEATMAQRISRAKATLRAGGMHLGLRQGTEAGRAGPATGRHGTEPERPNAEPEEEGAAAERLGAVQRVLYLVFNEGYTTSAGESLTAPSLSAEAIRLTRLLHRLVPDDGETAGLLALMLLTDARRPARTRPDGALVPLAEQDRTLWNRASVAEGVALLSRTLPKGRVGPYQLKAAIAAVHDEAPAMDATDWPQILGLYDLLAQAEPNPMTDLNRAVAVAMVHGPQAGLAAVAALARDPRLTRNHRLLATRAHLEDLAGDHPGAAADYRRAAVLTSSAPERRYLTARAAEAESRPAAG